MKSHHINNDYTKEELIFQKKTLAFVRTVEYSKNASACLSYQIIHLRIQARASQAKPLFFRYLKSSGVASTKSISRRKSMIWLERHALAFFEYATVLTKVNVFIWNINPSLV